MPLLSPEQHVAALVQWKEREGGTVCPELAPRQVRSLGLVGAGMMGTAIAAASIHHAVPVVLADADQQALAQCPRRVAAEYADLAQTSEQTASTAVERLLRTASDDEAIAACDLVLESITEKADAKKAFYLRIEPKLVPGSVLASNTSTIPIGQLGQAMTDPGRFCGLHFFHPVRRRRLVEVIRGPATRDETIATAASFARQIGKLPIVVNDGPGFLVNRLLLPYLTEAMELLQDGATIEAVEQAALAFGMAMGPLRLLDEIGLDTVLLGGRVLWQAFPERIVVSPLLINLYKKGRWGRKVGKGFFAYPPSLALEQPGVRDPELEPILAAWARPKQQLSDETILARLLLPMVLEATRVLDDKTVGDPRDVDLGVLFGLGFPAAKGGLLYWADALGIERVLAMFKPLESLGERMKPTPRLTQMASDKSGFFGRSP